MRVELYGLVVAVAVAVAVHVALRRARQQRPARSSKKVTHCVLQRDIEAESEAIARDQLFPVGCKVATRHMGTGKVVSYDPATKLYQVAVEYGGRWSTPQLAADALQSVTVSDLVIFPIKSCRGIRLDSARVTARGLANDRTWMFTDTDGKFITMRRYPRMALITPILDDIEKPTCVTLTAEGMPPLEVPILSEGNGQEINVVVWDSDMIAVDQGDAAANWINTMLQSSRGSKSFRFVYMKDSFKRPTDPKYAPGSESVFADGYPFLLAVKSSVDEVNESLDDAVTIDRFRPNIIISGAPAFADEAWNCITIGGIVFRNVKPCERCSIPCVDPETGERSARLEPRKTMVPVRNGELLGFHDGTPNSYYFGSNMIAEHEGRLSVGMGVKVLTMKTAVYA